MCNCDCVTGTGAPHTPGPLWQPSRSPLFIPSGDAGIRSPGRRRRRGAATVEFAVIAPVLFLLVLGLIEFSRAFMVIHLLTDAARQGCRTAVVGGKSTADICATVTTTLSQEGISGHTTTVKINGIAGEASAAVSGDEIAVFVSVPASVTGWLPTPGFVDTDLTGHWSLRAE